MFSLDDSDFQLPIEMLPSDQIHPLSTIVSSDLELHTMYEHILDPSTSFAREVMPKFGQYFTSNITFLEDTQTIIRNMFDPTQTACDLIEANWQNVRHDPRFLETYGYLEWECIESYNRSSSFLECLCVANMLSPLSALLVPIIFLIFPFIILQIQGVPITLETYIHILTEIAHNHFIGRAIHGLQDVSIDKIIYVVGTFGLYLLQMYQNVMHCIRFYNNTERVNTELCEWKTYLRQSVDNMKQFAKISQFCPSYDPFKHSVHNHRLVLEAILEELDGIVPFQCSLYKTVEIGYMLKCYYELHVRKDYADSIKFSMGFNGYLYLMKGVQCNLKQGWIHCADFCESGNFITQQYYPTHKHERVKNDAALDKHMVITGPNASGKTTFLKTTALNIIFTQQFGVGFYDECILRPYTHIHSYLNIPDTSGRDSLFQAESRRCKEILDSVILHSDIKQHHFCIFDELYSGTNPDEAVKTAFAFMKYMSTLNVDIILTTHYVALCEKWEEHGIENIKNYYMEVLVDSGKPERTYQIKEGISRIQGAIHVLEEMNYPSDITDLVREVSL